MNISTTPPNRGQNYPFKTYYCFAQKSPVVFHFTQSEIQGLLVTNKHQEISWSLSGLLSDPHPSCFSSPDIPGHSCPWVFALSALSTETVLPPEMDKISSLSLLPWLEHQVTSVIILCKRETVPLTLSSPPRPE